MYVVQVLLVLNLFIILISGLKHSTNQLLSGPNSLTSINLCPVSSLIEVFNDDIFTYPLDIYNNKLLNSINNHEIKDAFILTCLPGVHEVPHNIHNCSNINFCPLIIENIDDALNKTKGWITKPSLCILKDKLVNKSNTVNVLILGGSETAGEEAGLCFIIDEDYINSSNNPLLNNFINNIKNSNDHKKIMFRECSWSEYLNLWFETKSSATIKRRNLAMPGTSSKFMGEVFRSKLGPQLLSDNDVIFIDYSINDGYIFCI